MPPADAPVPTDRTESQRLGITAAQGPPPGAQGATSAPPDKGNGAHTGRGKSADAERRRELAELGTRVAEAISRGEFELARALLAEAEQGG